jgi:type IV secretory pathway VirB2 component (pilin)
MKKIITSLTLLGVLIFFPTIILAQGEGAPGGFCSFSTGSADVNKILNNTCNVVFGVAVFAVVIGLIVAGLYFVFAQGDPEKMKTARNFVLYSIIAVIVIFGAWVIIRLGKFIGGF